MRAADGEAHLGPERFEEGCEEEGELVAVAADVDQAAALRRHHRHGAHALTSGERFNLILWCRANPEASSEGANRHPHTCQPWCWMHDDGNGQPQRKRACK